MPLVRLELAVARGANEIGPAGSGTAEWCDPKEGRAALGCNRARMRCPGGPSCRRRGARSRGANE
jgi:hypothetical protein